MTAQQRCPVCDGMESRVLHRTTYPEFGYPGVFVMRQCAGCGLLFNAPRLTDAQIAALYGRAYYFFNRGDARELARIVALHQRTVGLIESRVAARTALDIGCGRGYLPAVMKERGWDVTGIELAREAAADARERFGLDVFNGTVEEFGTARPQRRFGLVIAADVIEHVPAPAAFVAAAARLVAPGGWLVVDTPNGAAANIETKGAAWQGFNPFHIYLFNADNLGTLLRRNGLEVEQVFSYGNRPAVRTLRDAAVRALKSAGLAGSLARLAGGLRRATIARGDPAREVAAAARLIERTPRYDETPDSRASFAASLGGDNLVALARRTS